MKILVTGAAGFIGFALSKKLLDEGHEILGLDNLNDYYDPQLKRDRLKILQSYSRFEFSKLDIANRPELEGFFQLKRPDRVLHLAAQAGVRYSIENPYAYLNSNLVGFLNILECCRHQKVDHLVYASTSSVYGLNAQLPYSVDDNASHPVSLYGATKRSNELMAHSYSQLYKLPTTGLRFFTVYGPWGRPDMAFFKFTKNIIEGIPIDVFNNGEHARDFTYVADIVEGLARVSLAAPPGPDKDWNSSRPSTSSSSAPYRLYNIGNNRSVELMRYIEVLEDCIGKKAKKNFLPMQDGDVAATHAKVDGLARDFSYQPSTPIETGLKDFVLWYREYYRL